MKVLVADDSPFCRAKALTLLREQGIETVEASNGEDAWEILQRPDAPRIVIADWIMPGMDGPDLCRMVRRHRAHSYTYFLLLTSRTAAVDSLAAIRAGVDDYLAKPYAEPELLARLNVGRRLIKLEDEIGNVYRHSRVLLDHSPFGIACLDLEGHVVDCNMAFAKLLDYDSPGLLIGEFLNNRSGWNPLDYRALLQQISLNEPFEGVSVRIKKRTGKSVELRLWGEPFEADGHKLYHLSSDYTRESTRN